MAEPRLPQFSLKRSQLAQFIKDPRTISDMEALARMAGELTPSDVATAQTTADGAQDSADAAQSTADTAQTTADNAQTTADNAQADATTALADAAAAQATANSKLDDAPSDGTTYGRKDGAWEPVTGGSSSGWTLLDQTGAPSAGTETWAWSVNVANVDVTGLGSYKELLIASRGLTCSSATVRQILLSVDGGTSFYGTLGDYLKSGATVAEVNADCAIDHDGTNSSARGIGGMIFNLDTTGVKVCHSHSSASPTRLFIASTSPVDAIRLRALVGNLTGGKLYVYGRS